MAIRGFAHIDPTGLLVENTGLLLESQNLGDVGSRFQAITNLNGVQVLSTTSGIKATDIGPTILFVVPASYTLSITDVIITAYSANTVTVGPTVQVGLSPGYSQWASTAGPIPLPAVDKSASVAAYVGTTTRQIFVAGDSIFLNIITGATATDLHVTVDLLGYLVSA